MFKKIFPFVVLVPFSIFVLLSFLGCGTVTSDSGGSVPPGNPKLFLTNTQTSEVVVVDINAWTIEARFLLPSRVNNWAALSPDGRKICYPSRDTNEVFIVNASLASYEGAVSVSSSPQDIEFTADGLMALVSQNGQVILISIEAKSALNSRSFIDATGASLGVALSPHNNRFYVVCRDASRVLSFTVEATSVTQVSTISVSNSLVDVCFPPASTNFLVSNAYSAREIWVYRATNESQVTTVSCSNGYPCKLAPSPDGTMVYACPVMSYGSNAYVDKIEVSAPSISDVDVRNDLGEPNASFSKGFAVSPDSSVVYLYIGVSGPNQGRILKLNKALTTVLDTLDIPGNFHDYYGSLLYVP